jgi:hypothetical protein
MQQLPDLMGLKDEVIIPRASRNVYDHAFDGTIQGQTIEGEVDLGEYGKARWKARRLESRQG